MESSEGRSRESEGRSQKSEGTLVCFAVKEEAAEFRRKIANRADVEILVTGMGKKNTERVFRAKLEMCAPSLVITCGFAGALNPAFKVGDVLFDADEASAIAEILRTAGAVPAKFSCVSHVATTAAEKTALRQSTGADVVEMESGIIREICREKGIPSATVRAISDAANQDLPLDFNVLMTDQQTISFPKLALALLKAPGKVPALMELQRNTKLAAQKLGEMLDALLQSIGNRG